jgi:hypothetical protein
MVWFTCMTLARPSFNRGRDDVKYTPYSSFAPGLNTCFQLHGVAETNILKIKQAPIRTITSVLYELSSECYEKLTLEILRLCGKEKFRIFSTQFLHSVRNYDQ